MFKDQVDSFDDNPLLVREHREHLATLGFLGARGNHDYIAFFHMKFHQRTSGASERIFIKFFSRSSRATGPKMRVPRGFIWLSIITMALLSNRRYEPSDRRISFLVRTTTAVTTSPFLTVPSEAASLIFALITSPIFA